MALKCLEISRMSKRSQKHPRHDSDLDKQLENTVDGPIIKISDLSTETPIAWYSTLPIDSRFRVNVKMAVLRDMLHTDPKTLPIRRTHNNSLQNWATICQITKCQTVFFIKP